MTRRIARPRRPSSSGIRPERLSALGLDPVGNGGLHAIEEEEAAEEDEGYGGGGNQEEQAGSLAVAGDGPAKTVNDAGHRVEPVEPAPARRNQRRWVRDGRSKHPELGEERHDVADVAI